MTLVSIGGGSFTKVTILSPTVAKDTAPNRTPEMGSRVSPATLPVSTLLINQQTKLSLTREGVKRPLNYTKIPRASGAGVFGTTMGISFPTARRVTPRNKTPHRSSTVSK